PGRLDRLAQLDPAPVDGRAARRLDRVGDLAGRDRTEQPAAGAGPRGQPHLQRLDLGLDLVGLAEVTDLTSLPGPLDQRHLLLGTLAPRDGEPLREQVVAPVPVLDLDHVAGRAEAGDLLGEDDLHLPPSSQRAVVVYGRSAIS